MNVFRCERDGTTRREKYGTHAMEIYSLPFFCVLVPTNGCECALRTPESSVSVYASFHIRCRSSSCCQYVCRRRRRAVCSGRIFMCESFSRVLGKKYDAMWAWWINRGWVILWWSTRRTHTSKSADDCGACAIRFVWEFLLPLRVRCVECFAVFVARRFIAPTIYIHRQVEINMREREREWESMYSLWCPLHV